jgi:hypothetical protein
MCIVTALSGDCNFIRPHMGPDGATPEETAGIGIDGENKWMGLLKRSIEGQK